MRLEIALLLNTGMTPKQVSEMLDINIHTIYYYQRELEIGKLRLILYFMDQKIGVTPFLHRRIKGKIRLFEARKEAKREKARERLKRLLTKEVK